MADIKLTDLIEDLDTTFDAFSVEFGSASAPRTVTFQSLVTATPAQQIAFLNSFTRAGQALSGALTAEEFAAAQGKTIEEVDAVSVEDVATAMIESGLAELKDAMRGLATSKKEFDAFDRQFKGQLVHWLTLVGKYCAKYGVMGIEDTSSQEK